MTENQKEWCKKNSNIHEKLGNREVCMKPENIVIALS